MKTRGLYFVFAGASAIIAALAIADFGDGAQDRLFVVLGAIGTVGFFIQGMRAGKSKAG